MVFTGIIKIDSCESTQVTKIRRIASSYEAIQTAEILS